MKMLKLFSKNQKSFRSRPALGFTVVETLVAISIVLVGVAAAFSAAQMGLSSTSMVRTRIMATFLAQEAFEAVKNTKDTNLLKIADGNGGGSSDWLSDFHQTCFNSNTRCGYDASIGNSENDRFFGCAGGGQSEKCQVWLTSESDSGYYTQKNDMGNHGDYTDTGLIRKIYIDETDNDHEAKVTVTVSKANGSFSPFVLTGYIYNWF